MMQHIAIHSQEDDDGVDLERSDDLAFLSVSMHIGLSSAYKETEAQSGSRKWLVLIMTA